SNEHIIFLNGSFVAVNDDGKVIGFIITKINKKQNIGHIQIIFIQSPYRRRRIAASLLKKAEFAFKNKGIQTVLLGADMKHYFPGIPVEHEAACQWAEKFGYKKQAKVSDFYK